MRLQCLLGFYGDYRGLFSYCSAAISSQSMASQIYLVEFSICS